MESTLVARPHLEAELWREVSQHLRFEESSARIVELLRERAPVLGMVVRHLERGPDVWSTLHVSAKESSLLPTLVGRRNLTSAELRALDAWLKRGCLEHVAELDEDVRSLLADSRGNFWALPVLVHGQFDAVVVVELEVGTPSSVHPSLVDALREAASPLGVAVENDLRLQQLARLREALQADRSALLSRLAKDDIGETLIGRDGGLRGVVAQVRQVARTDVPVLILGEAARNYKPENRAFRKVALRVGISRRPPEPSRAPSHKLPSAESSANRTHSLAARRTPALT